MDSVFKMLLVEPEDFTSVPLLPAIQQVVSIVSIET